MTRIAILDNGINNNIISSDKIVLRREWCEIEKDKVGKNLHGTICAKIILNICMEVEFYDLVVMQTKGVIDDMLNALEWCWRHSVNIIHMSIGTINHEDGKKLISIIDKLIQKGRIIVSAYNNDFYKTYPAHFKNVFGVCHTRNAFLPEGKYFIQTIDNQEIYVACMRHVYLKNGICVFNQNSNSFSAPVITGNIAKYLSKNRNATLDEIRSFLKMNQTENFMESIHLI